MSLDKNKLMSLGKKIIHRRNKVLNLDCDQKGSWSTKSVDQIKQGHTISELQLEARELGITIKQNWDKQVLAQSIFNYHKNAK